MKSIKKEALLEFLESIKNKENEQTVHIMLEAKAAAQNYASTLYGPKIKLDTNHEKPHAPPAPFKSTPSHGKEDDPRQFSGTPTSDIINTSQYKMKPFSEQQLEKPAPKPRKKLEPEDGKAPEVVNQASEEQKKEVNTDVQNSKLDKLASSFIWEDEFTQPEKRAILTIPKDMWVPFYKRELLLSEEDLVTSVTNNDQNMDIRCIDESKKVVYVPFMYLNKYYDVLGTHDILINGKKYAVVKAVPKVYADDVMAVNYKDDKVLVKRKQSGTYAIELMDSSPFFSIFTKESYETGYNKINPVLQELKGQPAAAEKKKAPAKPRKKRVKKEESK